MPSLNFEQVGVLVVGALAFWMWYTSWKREQRELAKEKRDQDKEVADGSRDLEPKATPPNHIVYATKAEHLKLELRVDQIQGEVRAGFDRLDGKRSSSIAGLHDDLEARTSALRLEVKQDIRGVHDRLTDVLKAVSKLEGKLENRIEA